MMRPVNNGSVSSSFSGDMLRGYSQSISVSRSKTRSCSPEPYRGHIFLLARLKLLYLASGSPGADDKHSCGKRVECAGVTHLELLYMKACLWMAPRKRFTASNGVQPKGLSIPIISPLIKSIFSM